MRKYFLIVAVSVFLLSCTEIERDNPYDILSPNYIPPSSSGNEEPSSSSETSSVSLCEGEEYDPNVFRCEYGELVGRCTGRDYYPAHQICEGGVIKSKNEPSSSSEPPPSSSSSMPGSSSSEAESSSSVAQSSSSAEPSSSSAPPSSSSETESSSSSSSSSSNSVTPSSSSTAPSSSSVAPSSSSSVPSSSSLGGGYSSSYGSVTHGDQTYKTVKIGEQTWFAENLNYAPNSGTFISCDNYDCDTYGRLYDWATAKTVCPSGWRLPTEDDWDELSNYVEKTSGCNDCDAELLKAASGWSSNNGTDAYGFSALPGGSGGSDGSFNYVGNFGYWWSASEGGSYGAYRRYMDFSNDNALWINDTRSYLFSVRCLQD